MGKARAKLGVIGNDGKSTISMGTMISDEKHLKLNESINEVEEFNQTLELYQLLESNENELNVFIEEIHKEIKRKTIKWDGVSDSDLREMTLELNRKLLNYLSSKKTYLDHTETFLKRKFGPLAKEVKDYKVLSASIYDSSFAYRFFYKLRNYAQHCGLPIEGIGFHAENIGILNVEIKILFNRDNLLKKFDGWTNVRGDLLKQPERFEMIALLKELQSQIKLLNKGFKETMINSLSSHIEYIKKNTEHLRTINTKVCIFSNFIKNKNGSLTYSMKYIPHDILDSLVE